MKRFPFASVALWIFALAMPAVAATTHEVLVGPGGSATFQPQSIDVRPGDTIVWRHVSGAHTVTSGTPCTSNGRFNSTVPPAGTVQYTVPANESPGNIPYFCIPHCGDGMTGTIRVVRSVPALSGWVALTLAAVLSLAGMRFVSRRFDA